MEAKDPLDRLAARLLAQGIADQAALEEVVTLVDAAEAAADAGEAADPTLAERVMFAGAEQ